MMYVLNMLLEHESIPSVELFVGFYKYIADIETEIYKLVGANDLVSKNVLDDYIEIRVYRNDKHWHEHVWRIREVPND